MNADLDTGKQAPGQRAATPREVAGTLKKSALKLLRQDGMEYLEEVGAGALFQATLQSEVRTKTAF